MNENIEEQFSKLDKRVTSLEQAMLEDKSARLIKKLRIDKDGKYLLLIPADLLNLNEAQQFSKALQNLGFNCTIARLPHTDGIKVVESKVENENE